MANIEQEIKDLQIKINALEELQEEQEKNIVAKEYELDQLNANILAAQRQKDIAEQSYHNIIAREKSDNFNVSQVLKGINY